MNRFKDGELIGVEKSDRGYVCWIYKWSLLVRGKVSWGNFDTGVTLTLYDIGCEVNKRKSLLTIFFYIFVCYSSEFLMNLLLVRIPSIPEVT